MRCCSGYEVVLAWQVRSLEGPVEMVRKVRFLSTFNTAPSTSIMIGIILATYLYPPTSSSSSDPLFYTADNIPSSSALSTEDFIPG